MWMHANKSVFRNNISTVDLDMYDLTSAVMAENTGNISRNSAEAAQVYLELRQEILALLS